MTYWTSWFGGKTVQNKLFIISCDTFQSYSWLQVLEHSGKVERGRMRMGTITIAYYMLRIVNMYTAPN